nr:MAG TPA: hypothetical protein [Caudoviricetes sp.]
MPGRVVDFLDMVKRKGSRKSCPCLKIFNCALSDLIINYSLYAIVLILFAVFVVYAFLNFFCGKHSSVANGHTIKIRFAYYFSCSLAQI